MEKFTYRLNDKNGIHARPAGMIVNCAKSYNSSVTMTFGEKNADCKRLFSVMALGAQCGDEIMISADGTDEKEACRGMLNMLSEAGL